MYFAVLSAQYETVKKYSIRRFLQFFRGLYPGKWFDFEFLFSQHAFKIKTTGWLPGPHFTIYLAKPGEFIASFSPVLSCGERRIASLVEPFLPGSPAGGIPGRLGIPAKKFHSGRT